MNMDIDLFYTEKGEGEPIIFLHGNGENGGYFVNQVDAFAERYHVYLLDTRGHGKSPRGDAPFIISQFADDLAAFMDEKKIAKAHVLGFSDGGNIALVFAIRYPDKTDKLILNGANLDFEGLTEDCKDWINGAYSKALERYRTDPAALRDVEMIGLMVNDPNIPPAELAKISAPTLVIAGTNDLIRREHTELIAAGIKNSRLVFIEGDHFIAHDAPEKFNAATLKFLSE